MHIARSLRFFMISFASFIRLVEGGGRRGGLLNKNVFVFVFSFVFVFYFVFVFPFVSVFPFVFVFHFVFVFLHHCYILSLRLYFDHCHHCHNCHHCHHCHLFRLFGSRPSICRKSRLTAWRYLYRDFKYHRQNYPKKHHCLIIFQINTIVNIVNSITTIAIIVVNIAIISTIQSLNNVIKITCGPLLLLLCLGHSSPTNLESTCMPDFQ